MLSQIVIISIVASLIGVGYLIKIRSYDIYEKEPFIALFLVAVCGGILSIVYTFVYVFFDVKENFVDAIIKIGLIEEFAKFMALVTVYPFIKKNFNEIVDGILYISAISLGFSVIENVFYAMDSDQPFSLLFQRSIFSTLGHLSFSGYMGIAFYIHKRIHKNYVGIVFSIVLAALAHGFYDGF